MAFHNVRDSHGRFAKKSQNIAPTVRKKVTKAAKNKDIIMSKVILNGFLLDASSSMGGKEESVVSGFNEIVSQGVKDTKTTGVVNKQFVAFFGSGYLQCPHEVNKLVWDMFKGCGGKVGDAVTYASNMGMTALWESTYKLITKLENELPRNPGAKVILTIFTDGGENESSAEWRDGTKIKALIEKKQAEGWVINFIGAGTQAEVTKVATGVGIYASNSLSFNNNSAGVKKSMAKMSASRSAYTMAVADGVDSNIGFFSKD